MVQIPVYAFTGFLDSGDHLCKLFLSVSFHTGNSKDFSFVELKTYILE